MIPGTINAKEGDKGSDSDLSDNEVDEALLQRVALHFGGDSRDVPPVNEGSEENRRHHRRRFTDANRPGSSNTISSNLAGSGTAVFHQIGRGIDSRTSMMSTSTKSSNSDNTIRRKNGEKFDSGESSSPTFSSQGDELDTKIGGNKQKPPSPFNGMSQIDEDCNEDHITTPHGSYCSNATSTAARTVPSMVESSISSCHFDTMYSNSAAAGRFLTEEEKEELEVERFSKEFMKEAQHSHYTEQASRRSVSSATQLPREVRTALRTNIRKSASNPRKRRSQTDMINSSINDAAEEAARFFDENYFSDSETDEDGSLVGGHPASRVASRRNSGRSNASVISSVNTFYTEERPRKRLSSSSIRSFGMGSLEDFYGNADINSETIPRDPLTENLEPIPGSDPDTIAAAFAAAAAEDATKSYEARLRLHRDCKANPNNPHPKGRRRAQRRAGFVVSSLQREVTITQAERMRRLERDRIESRWGRLGIRRSMSYSNGIKMKSNIIGISLPEDAEALGGITLEPRESTDIQKLARNRMERRVNSMPDPNAISRLSESSVNKNVDFSGGTATSRSALSATLDASEIAQAMAEPRYSLPLAFQQQNESFIFQAPDPRPPRFMPHQSDIRRNTQQGSMGDTMMPPSSSHESFASPNICLGPSNQLPQLSPHVVAHVKNIELESAVALQANTLIAEAVSATQQASVLAQQANLFMALQEPQINSNHSRDELQRRALPNSFYGIRLPNSNVTAFDDNAFDGKKSNVAPIPVNSPSELDTGRLLHEACKKDDVEVIDKVIRKFPLSTRFSLDSGEVALHIAAQHGNDASVRRILDVDPDSALIRDAEGNTPLHFAVDNGHLASAITLIRTIPQCTQIQCENGCLPIHDAVSVGANQTDTPQIMTSLLNAFENSVFVTNDEGLQPIHLAASSAFKVGIRTLLASEFSTIYSRDKLEHMLPLDVAVHQLEEYTSEQLSSQEDIDNEDTSISTVDSDPDRARLLSCVEILLSSMLYGRYIPSPRDTENGESPFLPLHSIAGMRINLETWTFLFVLYGKEHGADVDLLGRNVAHRICSRPIEDIDTDLRILHNLNRNLFYQTDLYGFIPLHLALQNKDVPFRFVMEVAGHHKSSVSSEVQPIGDNMYSNFLPAHIAAASGCNLDIIFFLMKSSPLEFGQ